MGCRAVTLDHTGEGVTHVASPPSREDLENALTEAKRVDADLRRIIDTIPVLAWCNLPDGSNEFHNQRWYDYTGLSPQEASGWGWRAAFQPDDLDPLMETWSALQSSGEAGEIEARMRRYDGEYRWFLLRFEPLRDELGNIVRWYGTNTDIDDLKRAQVALRQDQEELLRITDAIPQAIIVLSPEGRPLYTNRAALEYTGLSLEEVRAEDYRARIFHPEDLERLREARQSALSRPVPFSHEQRALGKDGQVPLVYLGRTEVDAYRVEGLLERGLIGAVAGIGACAVDLSLKRDEPVAASHEHRDGVPATREASRDGCARPGSYPGDHHDWVRHARLSNADQPRPQGLRELL